MYEIILKSKGFMWLYEAALPYVEAALLSHVAGTKSLQCPGWAQVLRKDFHYGILCRCVPVGIGIPPTLLMVICLQFPSGNIS